MNEPRKRTETPRDALVQRMQHMIEEEERTQQELAVAWEEILERDEGYTAGTLTARMSELKNGKEKGILFFLKEPEDREAFFEVFDIEPSLRDELDALIDNYLETHCGKEPRVSVVVELLKLGTDQNGLAAATSRLGTILSRLAEESHGRILLCLPTALYNTLPIPRGWDAFVEIEERSFTTTTELISWCDERAPEAAIMTHRFISPMSRWITLDFSRVTILPTSLEGLELPEVEHQVLDLVDIAEPIAKLEEIEPRLSRFTRQGMRDLVMRLASPASFEKHLEYDFNQNRDYYSRYHEEPLRFTLEIRAKLSAFFGIPLPSMLSERHEVAVTRLLQEHMPDVAFVSAEDEPIQVELLRLGARAEPIFVKLPDARCRITATESNREALTSFSTHGSFKVDFIEVVSSSVFRDLLASSESWNTADSLLDPHAEAIYMKLVEELGDEKFAAYFRARFLQRVNGRTFEARPGSTELIELVNRYFNDLLPCISISLKSLRYATDCSYNGEVKVPSTSTYPLLRCSEGNEGHDSRWGWVYSEQHTLFELPREAPLEQLDFELRHLANLDADYFTFSDRRNASTIQPSEIDFSAIDAASLAALEFVREQLTRQRFLLTRHGVCLHAMIGDASVKVTISGPYKPAHAGPSCDLIAPDGTLHSPEYSQGKHRVEFPLANGGSGWSEWSDPLCWPAHLLLGTDDGLIQLVFEAARPPFN